MVLWISDVSSGISLNQKAGSENEHWHETAKDIRKLINSVHSCAYHPTRTAALKAGASKDTLFSILYVLFIFWSQICLAVYGCLKYLLAPHNVLIVS